ncbi:MAG: DUF3791 domain-containing protein [Bacilli bacterium]|nr:DUF3791 domain-containing protein [Bacilli bacterium]
MNAEPIIMQIKYTDIVEELAFLQRISIEDALRIFYESNTYELMHKGISDMHCRSISYIVEDIINETSFDGITRYITLEEFQKSTNVKIGTIKKKKNREKIKGIIRIKNQYFVPVGSRYPMGIIKKYIKNDDDRRYYILKSIYEKLYVDEDMLGMHKKSFEMILSELENKGFIAQNNIGNIYGANAYDTTIDGGKTIKNTKNKSMTEIARMLGTAAGALIKELNS